MHKKCIHDFYVNINNYKNEMMNTVFLKFCDLFDYTFGKIDGKTFVLCFWERSFCSLKNSKLQGISESNIFGLFETLK